MSGNHRTKTTNRLKAVPTTRGPKPKKPYPDFPLFPHATGRWAKKIRGKFRYFGPWNNPDGALDLYLDQRDDLYAGREPRHPSDTRPSIREMCNQFRTAKDRLCTAGEITRRTRDDYGASCDRIIAAFGKETSIDDLRPADFDKFRAKLAETLGPVSLANEIGRIRVVFKFAFDHGLAESPVRYGQSFRKPSAKTLRLERAKKGPRMFAAQDIHALLKAANPTLKAMIHLAVNCGLGNHDVGRLAWKHLDLKTRWLDFPRPKTGIPRRAKLWPETIKAIQALSTAARSADPEGSVFRTRTGNPWSSQTALSHEFAKLLDETGLKRPGLGFYALRHTFETIAGSSRDQVAVDAIMGHAPRAGDMSAVYREGIEDERLEAVAAHVKKWLLKLAVVSG